jgi:hypothetical protein
VNRYGTRYELVYLGVIVGAGVGLGLDDRLTLAPMSAREFLKEFRAPEGDMIVDRRESAGEEHDSGSRLRQVYLYYGQGGSVMQIV